MNKVITQFKREFWECRAGFVRTPIYLALLLVAVMVITLVTTQDGITHLVQGHHSELQQGEQKSFSIRIDGEDKEMDPEFKHLLESGQLFRSHPQILGMVLAGVATIFMLVFLLVQQSYLLSALYSDRRDQSILFWKSLPVTETQSVLTKLATAVVAAPIGYLLAALAAGVVYLLILMGYAGLFLGMQMPGFGQILSTIFATSAGLLVAWLLFALWAMPIFCWLLFNSALAKKAPLLIAIAIPLSIAVLEIWTLGSSHLFNGIKGQFNSAVMVFFSVVTHPEQIVQQIGQTLSAVALWAGLVISAVLVAGSIWLRHFRYEI